ncbi:MAG TPA: VWA domain-containing protein [Candidatus Cloacimonadota bacterium]|nr:VWA domain-containing protein [Candidatus Cloacimonadota bacterium]
MAELKKWDEIWEYFEKKPETLEALQGIYGIYANPDFKFINFNLEERMMGGLAHGLPTPFDRLFADPLSLREAIRIAYKFVRKKLVEEPKAKTQIKGVTKEAKQSGTTFDVKLSTHEIGKIGFKRKKITSFKHSTGMSPITGPVVTWTSTCYNNAALGTYPTIKAAITDGAFTRAPFKINIAERHFRYPVYQSKQSFNIMLVLDISNSVKWILKYMEKIISVLTAQASASKDKLGLIIFQDDRARIMHHPTINVRHVIGTINTLVPKGKTPLADGLKMALQTLEHSRFQVTGMSNAIVLLSDCFPEPITGEYEDQLDEPACQNILSVCDKIAAAKIKFLIISPGISGLKGYQNHLGYRLGKLAAERAEGNYLNLLAEPGLSFNLEGGEYVLTKQIMKQFAQDISDFMLGELR